MIYFDNASTTLPLKEVVDKYEYESINNFANPSSLHKLGMQNEFNLFRLEKDILNLFKLSSSEYEVIFTSGATEANNLGILGYARANKNRGNHLITTKIEHESVLNVFNELEKEGFNVTYLDVKDDGTIDIDEFKKVISKNTILVSIMGINNEVGNILNLEEISKVIKDYHKVIFHSDLVQLVGKYPLDYKCLDMFTVSSHKIHGLKGVGALIKKKKIRLDPIIYGGGQQNNYRSGTIDYPGISAFYVALKHALTNQETNLKHVTEIHDYLYNELKNIDSIELNSFPNWSSYILSFSLIYQKASVLIESLSNNEIYVNGVSACNSKKDEPSYVLEAFHKDLYTCMNPIRISLSEFNTLEEAKIFITELKLSLNEIKRSR